MSQNAQYMHSVKYRSLSFTLAVLLCFAAVVYVARWWYYHDDVCLRSETVSTPRSRLLNRLTTNHDWTVKKLVERRANASDQALIQLIRDMMDPPSRHMIKLSAHRWHTPQSQEIESILQKKVCLFHIVPH